MAKKLTNYFIGFLAGVATGGTLGLFFFLNRKKKECPELPKKAKTEDIESIQKEEKYSFFNNFVVRNILATISAVTEKASEKRKYKKQNVRNKNK